MSNAFDNVWHEGIDKSKQNGLLGNVLRVVTNILYQRKHRVVLNGTHLS